MTCEKTDCEKPCDKVPDCGNDAPWKRAFTITYEGNDKHCADGVVLEQIASKQFILRSTVRFNGVTGLEGRIPDAEVDTIRTVTPTTIGSTTDLASVPTPLQWLVSRYGVHTPAALIHDRFIGMSDDLRKCVGVGSLTDAYTDRYFRFMLEAVGVRWLRRWMMWAAVALRTRWMSGPVKKILMIVWLLASVTGIGVAIVGIATGNWWWVVASSLAPVLFALLWERQYGAGLVAAYTAVWVLPPTVLGAVGYVIYRLLEGIAGKLRALRKRPASELRQSPEMHAPKYSEF